MPLPGRQGSPYFKLLALLAVFIFTAFLLSSFLEIFTLPSLGFLVESQKLSRDPLVQELKQAVVRITATPGRQADPAVARQRRGTGFNISAAGLIVTNRHLVEEASTLTVSFPGRKSCRVTGWSASPTADLALIVLEDGNFPFVELEREILPAAGDEVMVIGNPLNFYRVAVCGEVIGYRVLERFSRPVLEIDAPIYGGNSGSPVFNEKGKVVAVIFATAEGQEGVDVRGLALPVSLLEDQIARVEKEKNNSSGIYPHW